MIRTWALYARDRRILGLFVLMVVLLLGATCAPLTFQRAGSSSVTIC